MCVDANSPTRELVVSWVVRLFALDPSGAACTPFLHVSVAVRPPGFTVLSRTALELGYAGPETGHVKTLSAVTDVITFLGRCKARVNI